MLPVLEKTAISATQEHEAAQALALATEVRLFSAALVLVKLLQRLGQLCHSAYIQPASLLRPNLSKYCYTSKGPWHMLKESWGFLCEQTWAPRADET